MTTTSGNLPRLWTMCHVERADIWVNTKLRSPVPVPTDPGGPAGPVGPAGPSGPVGPAGPVAPSSSGLTSAVIHAPPVEVGGRTHALLCLPRPDLGLCDLDPDLVLPRGGLNSQTAHEEDDEQLGQLPSDPDRDLEHGRALGSEVRDRNGVLVEHVHVANRRRATRE